MEVTYAKTHLQRARCVSRPKLQGLLIGSSALKYDQRPFPYELV